MRPGEFSPEFGDDAERIDLQFQRTDYTSVLQEACRVAATAAEAGRAALEDWPAGAAQLDRALVSITAATFRATRLIIPTPDAMEYFGLPRSVTASAGMPEPAVRVQDPARESWDFRPWLSEKLSHLRDNLYAAIETTEALHTLVRDAPAAPPAEATAAPPHATSSDATGDTLRADTPDATGDTPHVTTPDATGDTPLQQQLDRARYELRAVHAYATGILNAVEEMGLTVVDWRLE